MVWWGWSAWFTNEGRVLFTKLYSTARRRHGWVDIRMTDDALVDRNRVGAFAATERSSVAFAATRGYGVVLVVGHGVTHRFRLDGAGRWAARRFGLTALQRRALGGLQRSEWVSSLHSSSSQHSWFPALGSAAGWSEGTQPPKQPPTPRSESASHDVLLRYLFQD